MPFRLKLALATGVVAMCSVLSSCSDDTAGPPPPQSVIDLYDPCTEASTAEVTAAVGFPMFRSQSRSEDADRFRSCRWVAGEGNADAPSIDYLDVDARPFVDIVLRQTGVDDEAGIEVVFAEVVEAVNSEPEPAVVSTPDNPRLAERAQRTPTGLWAVKGNRMLIIQTTDPAHLDALIEIVAPNLLRRL